MSRAAQVRKEQQLTREDSAHEPDANGIVSAAPPSPVGKLTSSLSRGRVHASSGSLLASSPSQRGSAITLAKAALASPTDPPQAGSLLASHPIGSAAGLSSKGSEAGLRAESSLQLEASAAAGQVNGHLDEPRGSSPLKGRAC